MRLQSAARFRTRLCLEKPRSCHIPHQEGRDRTGQQNRSLHLQEQGMDTVDANRALHLPDDAREYDDAANPKPRHAIRGAAHEQSTQVSALEALGITVSKRLPIYCQISNSAQSYLETKCEWVTFPTPLLASDLIDRDQ